jgi:solute carrier family 25 (mitochondrial carnitine/acylcarnitine transporter), member 20/29
VFSSNVLQTLRTEGLRGIYRGMGMPLATVAAFNSVLFATRGRAEAMLAHADGEVHD